MRRYAWIVAAAMLLALWAWSQRAPEAASGAPRLPTPLPQAVGSDLPRTTPTPDAATLPAEADATLRLIARGGPFPHRQDGATFQNRERKLPPQPRGYYREYTVETPGSRDRGARRIVTGGDPPSEYFYTDDHYRSFRRVDAADGSLR